MSEQKSSSSSPIIGPQLNGQQQVQEPTAGRALDALVAEKVMGWERRLGAFVGTKWDADSVILVPPNDTRSSHARTESPVTNFGGLLPYYSARMEDAWLIVFKAQLEKRMVSLNWLPEADEWACRIYPSDYSTSGEEACFNNPCEAICRAALQAVDAA